MATAGDHGHARRLRLSLATCSTSPRSSYSANRGMVRMDGCAVVVTLARRDARREDRGRGDGGRVSRGARRTRASGASCFSTKHRESVRNSKELDRLLPWRGRRIVVPVLAALRRRFLALGRGLLRPLILIGGEEWRAS